jgi:glutamyl-tRNA synthetase
MKNVRVRFAPSPTGGLHLGGVRTVLYNYLFARQHGGQFILRIEDTDQNRFVEGAEKYINDCLQWVGLDPDESPSKGGPCAPYRQSERKDQYRQYALQLVEQGHAYYAFDTPEELENMRTVFKSDTNPSPQYDIRIRKKMKNSLNLSQQETNDLIARNIPHVIRILMPENEEIHFTDMIRGEVSFQTSQSDDKVLLKADGMPTYHLAVVVDDYLMKITHAFRGEEWLPSAPAHILLWKYLGWEKDMPNWAHLPLILKPDGHGKLSKRDGDKLGFPVFAMNWKDPKTGDLTEGFRERGFLPEAFLNMLAVLGWNDGSEQEIFTLDELIKAFSIDRVHKGGAKFDFEKAKWFNHEWIKRSSNERLLPDVRAQFQSAGIETGDHRLLTVIGLVKERCILLPDFITQASFFFIRPSAYDMEALKGKWNDDKEKYFQELAGVLEALQNWEPASVESVFKELAAARNIKAGELLFLFRMMLVGGKFGPPVFEIASVLGKDETIARIYQMSSRMNN